MIKETSSLGLPRVINYEDIVAEYGLSDDNELGKAFISANHLILVNHLFAELTLANNSEKEIFKLSLAERFLREEIYKMQESASLRRAKSILANNLISRFFTRKENRLDNIYRAKEIIDIEKDKLTKYFSPRAKKRAHIIDLAANDLFPVYQLSDYEKKRLEKDSVIGEIPLAEWSLSWQKKLDSTIDSFFRV